MKTFKRIAGGVATVALLFGLAGPISVSAATSPVLVASAGYSILGASTVTCTGTTTVTGNVGVAAGTAITGFPTPCTVSPGTTESNTAGAIAAQADRLTAFGALDQGCNQSYGSQDLTLLSPLGPGVYCSSSTFSLSGNLTLTGAGPWIFKTVSGLNAASGSSVTVGDSCNLWWRVGSSAVIGTTSQFKGNILALTDINLQNGASLNGRAMVQTGQVTMDANTISGPTCGTPPPVVVVDNNDIGNITVVKKIINDNGGTKAIANFPLFVNGTLVASGVTNTFPAPAPVYTVSEPNDSGYTRTFSGDCDANGQMNLNRGQMKVCIVTNNDIGAPIVPVVPPLIDLVKVPSPLALPAGPGPVTYTYTVRNVGTVPMTDVALVGDTCSPIVPISGDANSDGKLDLTETWIYTCTTTLTDTHTNVVVVTGWANGLSATDIASATVVVGLPVVPPLIHVTKVPSPLALGVGGGNVTYTENVTNPGTVALSNVQLSDDTCAPMVRVSGDVNNDSKLDSDETWTYTCTARLANTTTNTAVATGEANGLTARDFAIATVVVAAAPILPKTGFTPVALGIIAAGVLAAAALLYVIRKKQTA